MTATYPLFDDPSPEVEAEMLAQHIRLTEPMETFLQATEDWMAASTKASMALMNSRYKFGPDQILLNIRLEAVKFQAEYLTRLLDDHVEGRLQPECSYPFAVMPLNSSHVFRDDFGEMFDIWTDADDMGHRNGTDLVHVYYALPGSGPQEEDDEEEDDGDGGGAEEEGAEEVVHHRIVEECITPPEPPKVVIPIAADTNIKESPFKEALKTEGWFNLSSLPEPSPEKAKPLGPRKQDRFKSKERSK